MSDEPTTPEENMDTEFGRTDFGFKLLAEMEAAAVKKAKEEAVEPPPKPKPKDDDEDKNATKEPDGEGDDEDEEGDGEPEGTRGAGGEEKETPPSDEKPKGDGEGPYARSWESIVRAQKKLRQDKAELRQEQQARKQRDEEQSKILNAIKNRDWAELERLGLDYTDWTKARLNSDDTSPSKQQVPSELMNEIREIKTTQQKWMESQAAEAQNAIVAQYLASLKQASAENDDLELVRGHEEDALQLAGMHFEATGEVLDPNDALQAIKEQILEDMKSKLTDERIAKYFPELAEKLKQTPDKDKEPPKPEKKKKGKTLTNKGTQSTSKKSDEDLELYDTDSRSEYGLRMLAELQEETD